MLQTETLNSEAFALVTEALASINQFNFRKDSTLLDKALNKLKEATELDPQYFNAFYYKGLVLDLKGDHQKAVDLYSKIVEKSPISKTNEVKYNLGIAHFHNYSLKDFEIAERYFDQIIEENKDFFLVALAKASKAQALSHEMIFHRRDHEKMEANFEKVNRITEELLAEKRNGHSTELNDVFWISYNARGCAFMYLDDNDRCKVEVSSPDHEKFKKNLLSAEKDLNEANKLSPSNWSVLSNLGSLHMRFGAWLKYLGRESEADSHFRKSISQFEYILERVRPGYGFAFYEMAKTYRLWEKFSKVEENINKAIFYGADVPKERLKSQKDRAEKGDSSFP